MIEKRYYNATTLERTLAAYEAHFALSSADFYAEHEAESARVAAIPGFHRHVWASYYREWRELEDCGLPGRVSRELELA